MYLIEALTGFSQILEKLIHGLQAQIRQFIILSEGVLFEPSWIPIRM